MQNRKGFTLIELLVVIAIIALLLSILMPALTKVKKQARAVVCMSNLKQWGMATIMYTTENNSKMWGDSYTEDDSLEAAGEWIGVLKPYYQEVDEIRLCPSARLPCEDPSPERRGSVNTHWGVPGEVTSETSAGFWGSYGLNRWATDSGSTVSWMDSDEIKQFWGKADVKQGQDIPVFLDATHWHFAPEEDNIIPPTELLDFDDIPQDTDQQMWRVTIRRHKKGVNAVFIDGTVRNVDLWKLWDLKWHRTFKPQKYQREDFGWL